jgi:hypothetical protein
MKQTAVEWLEEQTRKPEWHSLKRQDIFEQAKEMEKQQIVKAYKDGVTCLPFDDKDVGKQYYNETYKKP